MLSKSYLAAATDKLIGAEQKIVPFMAFRTPSAIRVAPKDFTERS